MLQNLDPSKWLVSLAGLIYDWILTREWGKVLVSLTPLVLLAALIAVVWGGGQLNRSSLAGWYLELANAETGEVEQNLFRAPPMAKSTEGQTGKEGQSTGDEAAAGATPDGAFEISKYADLLVRRVQMLEPSSRSQFIIAVSLLQRGAQLRGVRLLQRIAPDDEPGYPPAHALLTVAGIQDYRSPLIAFAPQVKSEIAKKIKHHALNAIFWEGGNEQNKSLASILAGSAAVMESESLPEDSLKFMRIAAEKDPVQNVNLMALADRLKEDSIEEKARTDAQLHAEGLLAAEPNNVVPRLMLTAAYRNVKDYDKAEEIALAGDQKNPGIIRELSNIYCDRFKDSMEKLDGLPDIAALDKAMEFDATNDRIPELVAAMADTGKGKPTPELIALLQQRLVEGKATTMTHVWLSMIYLKRENFEKAMQHMELIAQRSPAFAPNLNNLAYVYATVKPDKLEEAFNFARLAVNLSPAPNANYIDTLGVVLVKLKRYNEAIAAFQKAIEIEPNRIDIHQNIRDAYQLSGNSEMADLHAKRIAELELAQKGMQQSPPEQAAPSQEEAAQPQPEQTDAEQTPTAESVTPPISTQEGTEGVADDATADESGAEEKVGADEKVGDAEKVDAEASQPSPEDGTGDANS